MADNSESPFVIIGFFVIAIFAFIIFVVKEDPCQMLYRALSQWLSGASKNVISRTASRSPVLSNKHPKPCNKPSELTTIIVIQS